MRKKEIYDDHMLTLKEKRLMEVMFQGGAAKEDIQMFTQGMDVDTESSDYMLMLSCLGHSINWNWFPKEMIPRLQGLYRYYQVRNAMGIKGILSQIDLLNRNGIPVMFLKGMAMRYYYAEGVPRIMSDMDLLVPEERFDEAVKLLCAAGGTKGVVTKYSIHIVNGIASVDLHCWMFKHHGEKDQGIWERAVPVDFYGKTVYVPSPEDMFVHQLDTKTLTIFAFEAEGRRMRWLYDCGKIAKKETFDEKTVLERIRQFHVENTSCFAMKALTDCFPDMFSASALEELSVCPSDYEKWLRQGLEYRKHMQRLVEVKDGHSIWKHAVHWLTMRKYDYRRMCYEEKIIYGRNLSIAQYIKNLYDQETVWGSIKSLLKRTGEWNQTYKERDRIG